jgi:hypothetical protein
MIDEESVEAKTLGIGHGSQKAGRKTRSRRMKIKNALRMIEAVITVEDLLQFVVA